MFKRLIVKGNRYEMGYQLGKHFKKQIDNEINKYIDYLKDETIKARLDNQLNKLKELIPECIDELKGKADGAGVDYYALALMHAPELTKKSSGCTTAIFKKKDRVLFSHNEDDYYLKEDDCAIVKYEYDGHFTVAFTLYNKLSGSCHGYNSYGLVYSCNYLFHEDSEENYDNLSRYLVSRKLIECKTIDECLNVLHTIKPIQPFSFNVLDANTNEVINIENDLDKEYITKIESKYARSNHFLCKDNPKMSDNSMYRAKYSKERIEELNDDASIDDLKWVLDYENEEYVKSIFMDPNKYMDKIDNSYTLENMSFDSYTKEVIFTDCFDRSVVKFKLDEFTSY